MSGDKNPRRKEGLTPLHLADGKVRFEVYTFIMKKILETKKENTISSIGLDFGRLDFGRSIWRSGRDLVI